jgi:AcrR family transcriptional regulator
MAKISSDKPQDRRIAKTRQAIHHALFQLIASEDWSDISVSKLCEKADVARSTFYLHYASPTDVLDDMIAQIVAAFPCDDTSPLSVLEWLVDHIATNRAIFQRTALGSQSHFVIDRFKAGIMVALENENGTLGDKGGDIRTAMVVGAAFQAIHFWSRRWNLAEVDILKAEICALRQFLHERSS